RGPLAPARLVSRAWDAYDAEPRRPRRTRPDEVTARARAKGGRPPGHARVIAEPRHDGVEEAPSGVHVLPGVPGVRVVAVLADAEHAGHRNLAGAQGDGLLDAPGDAETVLPGQVAAQAGPGGLVGVQRRQPQSRPGTAVLV